MYCPERDKIQVHPPDLDPHGAPPADAGALGAMEACSFL